MDLVDQSAVLPGKSRLARTFVKVLHIQAVTGVTPADGTKKTKQCEKVKVDLTKIVKSRIFDEEDEKLRNIAATEAFIAKLFASISAVKAGYAQLQLAQSPYDADGIQSADQIVVSELKSLSELKQCYLKKQFDEFSAENFLLKAEILEQNSLLKTYEAMARLLDSQLRLKDLEITFLREKLKDANRENKSLEKRLNSSRQFPVRKNLHTSGLTPNHFSKVLTQTIKGIQGFVRLMIDEMGSCGWDLDAAASSIEPNVLYWHPKHRCFAFVSFVCRELFDGFNHPNFLLLNESSQEQKKRTRIFFDDFMQLKSVKPKEYLAQNPKSMFAKFCRIKYLQLVHPMMESSLFGDLNQRNLVNHNRYPETNFFGNFVEMAKRVWLLHSIAYSFEPEASIFQVMKGTRFSEVFMECVNEEAFLSSEADRQVAFTVVPGFNIGNTIIQCQVYLS